MNKIEDFKGFALDDREINILNELSKSTTFTLRECCDTYIKAHRSLDNTIKIIDCAMQNAMSIDTVFSVIEKFKR